MERDADAPLLPVQARFAAIMRCYCRYYCEDDMHSDAITLCFTLFLMPDASHMLLDASLYFTMPPFID